eukprot:scaffold20268_cov64-Cyclotella_meneghiniana.AAC.14
MVVEQMIGPMIEDIVNERLASVERAIEEIVTNPTAIYAPKVAVAVKKDLDPILRALVAQVHKNTTVVETLFKSAVKTSRGGEPVDEGGDPFVMTTAFDTMMRLQDAVVDLKYNTNLSTNAFTTMANKITRAVERNEDNTRRAAKLGLNPRSAIEALAAALADPELNERLQEVVNHTKSQDGEVKGEISHHAQQEGQTATHLEMLYEDDDSEGDMQRALHNSLEDVNKELKPAANRDNDKKKSGNAEMIGLKPPPEGLVKVGALEDERTNARMEVSVARSTEEVITNTVAEYGAADVVMETPASSTIGAKDSLKSEEIVQDSAEEMQAGNEKSEVEDTEMKGQEIRFEEGAAEQTDTLVKGQKTTSETLKETRNVDEQGG